MNLLKLTYTTTTDSFKLKVFLDSKPIEFIQTDNCIEIPCDLTQGFHLLTVQLIKYGVGDLVIFKSAELDGVDFKHTFYTMFANPSMVQTTCLSSEYKILSLPFMNPLAWWFSSCAIKIPSKYYSGGLYEELSVYYPQSIDPGSDYPKVIRDYFKENMDFYVHPKYTVDQSYFRNDVPYVLIGDRISYDETALFKEFTNNLEFLIGNSADYLKKDSKQSSGSQGTCLVTVVNVRTDGSDYDLDRSFHFNKKQFPALYEFFKQLPIKDVVHAFVGILAPKQSIQPHVDSYVGFESVLENYQGCNKLYIPINFKPGNYFKIANVGNIPTDQGPVLVNTQHFVHGLFNDSAEYRFAIGIIGSKIQ
jgi:hypothetical protein